jgi:hypothetical protein
MTKLATVVEISTGAVSSDAPQPLPGEHARVGWIASWSAEQGLLVDHEGSTAGPVAARTTVRLDAAALQRAVDERQQVLLLFEGGAADRPIVIGLIEPLPAHASREPAAEPGAKPEARIDGKRVELEAEDEIVLRCGEASITLRRNGRVVIRGAYVESRSRGTNRIKGGNVQIN